MRLLIAPDKFAGTLSAAEAAAAIEEGWRRTDPSVAVTRMPLADGGPGFLDAIASAVDGELLATSVRGPLGDEVPAAVLLDGTTAYVESAQACGLHLVPADRRDPWRASSYGVGQLVEAARAAGAERIVVGLGGSGTVDGGAGLLAALGAEPGEALAAGLGGLPEADVDLGAARERLAGIALVAASDVDVPLLGGSGAAHGFGRQKGLATADLAAAEEALARFAAATGADAAGRAGAGAAGGLGFALLALGGTRVNGVELLLEVTAFAEAAAAADLVVTGEGALDWQSLRGKVVTGVTRQAGARGKPVVVLAGRVEIGRRELATAGIDAAYALVSSPGDEAGALARPAQALADLAERVARTWR